MTPSRTVQRHVVVPARAVEHGAGEGVEPLDVGVARVVEHTGGGDHDVDLVAVTGGGLDAPAAVVFEAPHLVAEADQCVEAVAGGDALEVREDLRPGENGWLQSGFGAKEYE